MTTLLLIAAQTLLSIAEAFRQPRRLSLAYLIFCGGEKRSCLSCGAKVRIPIRFATWGNKKMTKKLVMLGLAICVTFVLAAIVLAQKPPVNVGDRHGNMRAAQQLIQQAWEKSRRSATGQSLQPGRPCRQSEGTYCPSHASEQSSRPQRLPIRTEPVAQHCSSSR